jgi:hypothetical protein
MCGRSRLRVVGRPRHASRLPRFRWRRCRKSSGPAVRSGSARPVPAGNSAFGQRRSRNSAPVRGNHDSRHLLVHPGQPLGNRMLLGWTLMAHDLGHRDAATHAQRPVTKHPDRGPTYAHAPCRLCATCRQGRAARRFTPPAPGGAAGGVTARCRNWPRRRLRTGGSPPGCW